MEMSGEYKVTGNGEITSVQSIGWDCWIVLVSTSERVKLMQNGYQCQKILMTDQWCYYERGLNHARAREIANECELTLKG